MRAVRKETRSNSLRNPGKRAAIKDALLDWMAEQKLRPGDRILGQVELARRFGVTQVTMFKALKELAREGKIHRKNGKGTFVGPEQGPHARRTACLILPGEHLDNPEHNPQFWAEVQSLLHTFTVAAAGCGWSSATHPVMADSDPVRSTLNLSKYDAIFFHHTKEPAELLRFLTTKTRLPVAAFGQPDNAFPCLTMDYSRTAATRLGVSHLASLGYRRIALIDNKEYFGSWNLDGHRSALKELKIPFDERLHVYTAFTPAAVSAAVHGLIREKVPFDAVFAMSDMLALAVLETLRASGIPVPEKVGLLGFDGIDYACRMPPFLTSVQIPLDAMIREALGRFEKSVRRPAGLEYIEFPCRILPGKTACWRKPAGNR